MLGKEDARRGRELEIALARLVFDPLPKLGSE